MKVTDLKIGDWIEAHGCKYKVCDTISDCFNYDRSIKVNRQKGDTLYPYPILEEEIRPIPLTAAILMDNGFRCQWDYIYTIPAVKPNELWLWDKAGEWEVTYNNNEVVTTIRFVHELQHLLWALGLDDNLNME